MTVYSYNATQLNQKIAPKKPFWSRTKITIATGVGVFCGLVVLVAVAPEPQVEPAQVATTVAKAAPAPLPKAALAPLPKPSNNVVQEKAPTNPNVEPCTTEADGSVLCVDAQGRRYFKYMSSSRENAIGLNSDADRKWAQISNEIRQKRCNNNSIDQQYC